MNHTLLLILIWISVSAEFIMVAHDFKMYPNTERWIVLYPASSLFVGVILTGVIFNIF